MNITPWNKLGSALLACAAVMAVSGDADAAPPKEGERQTLSKHSTVAQFEGIAYQRCMGLTALCPDQCGSSGDFATFRILKYLGYEKPGEYGDPKQTEFVFQVEDNHKNPKVSAEVKSKLAALSKGDYVRLDWVHDYVTKGGTSSPERICTRVEKITREEADKLTGGLDKVPAPKPKAGIQPRGPGSPPPAAH
jgi:hypothetical protein